MKQKIIQILLGAIGSLVTVIITHYANVPADMATIAALGSGSVATAAAGNFVNGFFTA